MSQIITCTCGAKLQLREELIGQRLRCPRCREVLETLQPASHAAVGAAAQGGDVAGGGSDNAASTGTLCPICQTDVQDGEVVTHCQTCNQVHHQECWSEMGGCATYGCSEAPQLQKPDGVDQPLSAWGDTKQCPACGESIKSIAVKCRYCQTMFDTVDPLSADDLVNQAERGNSLRQVRIGVVVLFILSVLGCAAPLTLIVALAWFLPKRREVARLGPQFLVLGWAALSLSTLYCFLILMFIAIGS